MLLDVSDCQLVLVDYQPRLMPVIAEGEQVLARALMLARMAQLLKVPTFGTEQNPAKAKEINDELQKMDLGTASADLPDKCQLIDQRLKELGSAEKKAEGL